MTRRTASIGSMFHGAYWICYPVVGACTTSPLPT